MKSLLLVVLGLGLAAAVKVSFTPCDGVSNERCTVSDVRIDPCKETPKPCNLRKKTNSSIEFDFTPKFSANTLKTGAYWATGGAIEPSFADLKSDGCLFTQCPVEAEKSQTFTYRLYISKLLPDGNYDIKWKLWNEADSADICCFKTSIKIRK